MAKILYAPGIEKVSGAMSKINTKSRHADDQNMFLATHREAATQSKTCSRAYFRKINSLPWQNTSLVPSSAIQLRARFTAFTAAIKARKKDLMTLSLDQDAYLALRREMISKTGITPTVNVFYWAAAKKYGPQDGYAGPVTWPEGAIALTYNELLAAVNENRSRQGKF